MPASSVQYEKRLQVREALEMGMRIQRGGFTLPYSEEYQGWVLPGSTARKINLVYIREQAENHADHYARIYEAAQNAWQRKNGTLR